MSETLDLPVTQSESTPVVVSGDAWFEFRKQLEPLIETASALKVTADNHAVMAPVARSTRLALKKIRVAIDHKRLELVEDFKRQAKAIDTKAKDLREIIEPLEDRMQEAEEFAERAETARVEKLASEREKEIETAGGDPRHYANLGSMPEEAFGGLVTGLRAARDARVAAEKLEREQQAAKAKAEAEERERIRLENERLKAEAAEKEAAAKAEREAAAKALKAEQEKAAAERAKAEAAALKERQEAEKARLAAEAKARAERDAIEEKARQEAAAAAEVARKEREAIEAKAKTEREKAEAESKERSRVAHEALVKADAARAEAEAAATREREAREKIEIERIEAEDKARKEREEAARQAAAAPDREKLKAFAQAVRSLPVPELTTEAGIALSDELAAHIEKFAAWILKKSAAL